MLSWRAFVLIAVGGFGGTVLLLALFILLMNPYGNLPHILFSEHVIPDINYEPRQLVFDDKHRTRTVKFSPGRLKQFSITGASCSHPAFTVRHATGAAEVEVTIDPAAVTDELPVVHVPVSEASGLSMTMVPPVVN